MNIFGSRDNPYYIWAPRWIGHSAGIRCIHYLCNSLNTMGKNAYLVFADPLGKEQRINPLLNTPILTQEVADAHTSSGLRPIVVYPEGVIGNPMQGPLVVRFLWNYAGALGGPERFDKDEYVVAFSESISQDYAKRQGIQPKVLFVPPVDPSEFVPQFDKKPYQVVYAGKYRNFVGEPHPIGNLPSVEIYRSGPRMQSRDQVKKLLAEASVLYSFENSSIVTEAILSGTPAGFIPNDFLGEVIAKTELGAGGTFLGDSGEDIELARRTVTDGIEAYHRRVLEFEAKLKEFVNDTQDLSKQASSTFVIRVPQPRAWLTPNRLKLAYEILVRKGPIVLAREVLRFLRSIR